MKPQASPLNIIDFAIMDLQFKFIPPKENLELDIKQYFNKYELDIDFTITKNEIIQVFIKTEINRGKKVLPGYSIFAEIACIFEFNKQIKISDDAKMSIEGFSTIYIALNNLRGFISQVTANGPVGRYILPSIDLNDLINKKKEILVMEDKKSKKVVNEQTAKKAK